MSNVNEPMLLVQGRLIQFRGKNKSDPHEWVYGSLCNQRYGGANFITEKGGAKKFVDPSTIGQMFRIVHSDGFIDLFEGDVVLRCGKYKILVGWDKAGCRPCATRQGEPQTLSIVDIPWFMWNDKEKTPYYQVIGNIHDNPGLGEECLVRYDGVVWTV